MATRRINCRIDRELDAALSHFEQRFLIHGQPATRSQAVREILRQAITTADPPTRGWHEGYNRGYADAQEALQRSHADQLPPSSRPGAGAQSPPGRSPRTRK